MEPSLDGVGPDVLDELRHIFDPCSVRLGTPTNILDLGLIDGIEADDTRVRCHVTLTSPACPLAGELYEAIEGALARLAWGRAVEVLPTGILWDTSRMNTER
jgi:metal-sulfur cluster biosynthetic enzyme